MKKFLIIIASAALLLSCNTSKPEQAKSEVKGDPTYSLTEVWRTDTIMSTCESVLFDTERQVLFVSCINGKPAEKNGTGYISMLDLDGGVKSLEWVSGLNAPKGMGILEGYLYVTDIDELVVIDIEKAEIIDRIPVEGASFLNDIDISPDGKVYFSGSDSGNLWIFDKGEVKPWIQEDFKRPNGLFVEDTRVLLTCSGSQDLKIIDKATGTYETVATEIGHGDGVEYIGVEGHYITSSWSGEVFLIFPDFSKQSLLKTSDQEINSADIAFNIKKQVVYIPTFFDNRVVAYKLNTIPPAGT